MNDLFEMARIMKYTCSKYGLIDLNPSDMEYTVCDFDNLLEIANDYDQVVQFEISTYGTKVFYKAEIKHYYGVTIVKRFRGKEEFENARKQYGESIGLQI